MADTLQNITLPADTWVNIYTHPVVVAAGITVGTQISAQNIGQTSVRVHAGADAPTGTDGYRTISIDDVFANAAGDTGAWMMSLVFDGLTNVRAE